MKQRNRRVNSVGVKANCVNIMFRYHIWQCLAVPIHGKMAAAERDWINQKIYYGGVISGDLWILNIGHCHVILADETGQILNHVFCDRNKTFFCIICTSEKKSLFDNTQFSFLPFFFYFLFIFGQLSIKNVATHELKEKVKWPNILSIVMTNIKEIIYIKKSTSSQRLKYIFDKV